MTRARKNQGLSYRGLSRGATYRFAPDVARELELQATVRNLQGLEHGTQKAIVEEALRLWFKKNPMSKKHRAAAEVLMGG